MRVKSGRIPATDIVAALLSALLILSCSRLAVRAFRSSDFYLQGKFLHSVSKLDGIGALELVQDGERLEMAARYLSAVADAYVQFELIPINEAQTFAAVFKSFVPGISIDGFSYRRRDLSIDGVADTESDYEGFLNALRDSEHFAAVRGSFYVATDDRLHFIIECDAVEAGSYINF